MVRNILVSTILISVLSACSFMRSNQPDPAAEEAALASAMMKKEVDIKTEQLMKKPGLIHIERHTPEYSISLVLDASDDNIYFEMDLPENQQEPTKKQQDKQQDNSEEEKPAKTDEKTVNDQATAPKNDDKNIDPASESTKHVLYAQTYFFEKKYNRALSEINRALEYRPDSAVAHSLQGSILYKLKKRGKAREAWEKALELDPNIDNVESMLKKMDNEG